MYTQTILTAWLLSNIYQVTATPIAFPQQTGAKACDSDPLTADTWNTLGIDTFLTEWTKTNVTEATTNNVQALADSFGAPNFFCGLDNFCNAGQPCLPVTLPAWYAMISIQNWNSYMNSVNTAVLFASSIAGLVLPEIVTDFIQNPRDDVTEMKAIFTMFTSILSAVPLVGPLNTAKNAITGGASFLLTRVKPPAPTDKFVAWTNVAGSLAEAVTGYQAALTDSMKAAVDTPVGAAGGINEIIAGGAFMGTSSNVTQSELQKNVIETMKVFSMSLALKAQGIYVQNTPSGSTSATKCDGKGQANSMGNAGLCVNNPDGSWNAYILSRDEDGARVIQFDIADTLVNKYGMKKEDYLVAPVKCFNDNKNQAIDITETFASGIPLDPATNCLFYINVNVSGL